MVELTPYAAMKDSGVEWLGDVPAHWSVLPNRAVFNEAKRSGYANEKMLSVTISSGVICQDDLLQDSSMKDQSRVDKSAYKLVQPGDIAYNKMRAWQGAIGVSRYKGIVSPAYVVQQPQNASLTKSAYLHYLFRTPAFAKEAERSSFGITSDMWSLRPEDFKTIRVCVPPSSEQTVIVRFLEHATGRIDRYIGAKEKLISLLEEQRQVIIHYAVTGGIDVRTGKPYPAYKPSGAEWLGEVPAHWEVRRLRYLTKRKLTYGANASAEFSEPMWPRYLRITDFAKNGQLRTDTFRSLPPDIAQNYLVEPGDVLLARSGATVGKAFFVDETAGIACFAGYLIRVQLVPSLLSPKLFFAFTQSAGFMRWKEATLIRATIQNISADKYSNLSVPVPPTSEQRYLLRWLHKFLTCLERDRQVLVHEVDLLREYRTRLIADVVTGNLDVREAAAKLPELDPVAGGDGDEMSQPN